MTDQEWLAFVQTYPLFKPVAVQVVELVRVLMACKFHASGQFDEHVPALCEFVYQIIAQTSSGSISLESGFNVNVQKTVTT